MFCFLFCLVALGICAVSSADQNEQCKSNILFEKRTSEN